MVYQYLHTTMKNLV